MHACELAAQLGIATVIVPRYAEGLSALGMLLADCVRDYSLGVQGVEQVEPIFARLEARARRETPGAAITRTADLRYAGQSYEINVPWEAAEAAFHREHKRLYGFASPARRIDVVTIRVRARAATVKPLFPKLRIAQSAAAPVMRRRLYTAGRWRQVPVLDRSSSLLSRTRLAGPILVTDYGATTLAPPGWYTRIDGVGNLVLTSA